jgi:nitrite reductase/ring-hydroxylating ferredoxin subunit
MIELPVVERTMPPDGRPGTVQPAWRRAFPIDTPQDQYLARRDFTRFVVLASLAFALGHLWLVVQNWLLRRDRPGSRSIAALAEVPVGGVVSFPYPGANDPCLLIRPAANTLLAYSQKCTHLGCAVVPELEQQRLHCPCHRGYFDAATGRPLAGPPRRPLPRINLEVRDGVVYATGVEMNPV